MNMRVSPGEKKGLTATCMVDSAKSFEKTWVLTGGVTGWMFQQKHTWTQLNDMSLCVLPPLMKLSCDGLDVWSRHPRKSPVLFPNESQQKVLHCWTRLRESSVILDPHWSCFWGMFSQHKRGKTAGGMMAWADAQEDLVQLAVWFGLGSKHECRCVLCKWLVCIWCSAFVATTIAEQGSSPFAISNQQLHRLNNAKTLPHAPVQMHQRTLGRRFVSKQHQWCLFHEASSCIPNLERCGWLPTGGSS